MQYGDLRLVLDLGSGSLRSLVRMGEAVLEVDAVGFTHRHMDHVGDLLPFLFALRHTPGLGRTKPLTLFGYRGLRADLERLAELFGRWALDPGFELQLHELAPGESLRLDVARERVRVTAHPVRHSPEAVGLRLELSREPGRGAEVQFAYSGDTGATESLIELARGADLFVCECAFPDGEGVEGHLTPSELLPICAKASPRRTLTTHFYPVWDERGTERLWRESLERFGHEVSVAPAHDGLRIDFGGDDAC